MTLHLFIGLGCPPPQHTACDVGQRLPPPRRRIPAVAPNSAGIAASLIIAEPAGETMDKLPTSANLFAAPAARRLSVQLARRDGARPHHSASVILPSSFGQPASNVSATAADDELLLFKSSRTSPPGEAGHRQSRSRPRALSDATAGNGADYIARWSLLPEGESIFCRKVASKETRCTIVRILFYS